MNCTVVYYPRYEKTDIMFSEIHSTKVVVLKYDLWTVVFLNEYLMFVLTELRMNSTKNFDTAFFDAF